LLLLKFYARFILFMHFGVDIVVDELLTSFALCAVL